ncbi:AlpA family transcriptional regulator [Pseudoalteromonas shioyasakiensis]|uniref:helix-turn-helix transcriptional regulator n=1 Tax=Pseudoalteromonas shioyasakiensis TaxID=1190813 RepID=UPI0022B09853|nr:AlpA family transcriptional regulator [Pseudoalteromonas shioyasakiensis]MCZ4251457.1 AlpA family transcriptional regulator [Pseudoalteromonas shioyasakiensis]
MTIFERNLLISYLEQLNNRVNSSIFDLKQTELHIKTIIDHISSIEDFDSTTPHLPLLSPSQPENYESPNDLLRQKEVSKLTGLSRTTIYTLIQRGAFPNSIKISTRSVAWRRGDIWEWINSKV